ncbi:MAG: DUF4102 domain-containing protein [Methylocapsa sp.]|nr:DUF4102 domain-containing protein [Methylocapsa sp.]
MATASPGRYGDGRGLWLAVSSKDAAKWVFRFSWQGRVTEAGLGAFPAVGLAEAREKAAEARKLRASRINPIEARRAGSERGGKGRSELGGRPDLWDKFYMGAPPRQRQSVERYNIVKRA